MADNEEQNNAEEEVQQDEEMQQMEQENNENIENNEDNQQENNNNEEEDNLGPHEEGEEGEEGENEEGEFGEYEDREDLEDGENEEVEEGEEQSMKDNQQMETENKEESVHESAVHSQEYNQEESQNNDEFYEEDEEKEEDEEADELLPPERKVRYRLFKFINKMRTNCHMIPYSIDLIGNNLAMEYAKYLLTNKENEEEFNNLAKKYNFSGEFKVSNLDSFVDTDINKAGASGTAKYTDFMTEFYDVQATLVEFEQHSENILSDDFNKVGIGMAFNDTKVVVVDVFCFREVFVDSCNINTEGGNIQVKGRMNNEQYGAYALRIVNNSQPKNTLVQITPQHITPFMTQNKTRGFTGVFNNVSQLLQDPEPKIIEVYIRVKPDSIPYNKAFTDKINFDTLILGARIPLENFPIDKQIKEEKRQDARDEKIEKNNLALIAEYERKKDEEKKRRMKIDNFAYGSGDMGEIQEEPDEERDLSDGESQSRNKSSKINDSKADKDKESDSNIDLSHGDRLENYERELNDLELTNEKLKEDNELIQKKIKVIYDFKKKEGREERNFYKESNINESTYADSLSSTAGLYNDLNSHKTKLDQDLKRYQSSIDEQENRKQDVYEILMKYKEELLENAETRKGTKIPKQEVQNWLNREKKLEDDIRKLRIQSFTKSLEMNRLKKELKKMEDYFEGLHIIDFEQLKIENNTLTEKIEDRNEEIHKLRNKINSTVQTLAHLQEKSRFVSSQNEIKKQENENLKKEIIDMKKKLTEKKEMNDVKANKQLSQNKKIDQINSIPLKNYYKNTMDHIQNLSNQIDVVSRQLLVYRQRRKAPQKDIKDLLQRKERMMKDYKTLPVIENDEKY
jgi:hypothetical protein